MIEPEVDVVPQTSCPHCGERERIHLRQDDKGLVIWCQACFRVTEVSAEELSPLPEGEGGVRG
jgi:transcription elongation factor Elf1